MSLTGEDGLLAASTTAVFTAFGPSSTHGLKVPATFSAGPVRAWQDIEVVVTCFIEDKVKLLKSDLQPHSRSHSFRRRVAALSAVLIAANATVIGWALAVFHHHPALLATAGVAYGLGLRHAVDADHIAAIDNVTRKLVHEGQRPVGVGVFFSLGHSTVVFLLSVVIATTAAAFRPALARIASFGEVFGPLMSGAFLLVIAAMNTLILAGLWRSYRVARAGQGAEPCPGGTVFGPITRLVQPLFGLVSRSRHMFRLGLLFGLGFDTATEVGLLGMSASGADKGLPIWSILVFPALFAAAMSLVDAAGGILMLNAYGWALVRPLQRITYNLVITLASILVAVAIGAAEIIGVVQTRFAANGSQWSWPGWLDGQSEMIGCAALVLFVGGWQMSAAASRSRSRDIQASQS